MLHPRARRLDLYQFPRLWIDGLAAANRDACRPVRLDTLSTYLFWDAAAANMQFAAQQDAANMQDRLLPIACRSRELPDGRFRSLQGRLCVKVVWIGYLYIRARRPVQYIFILRGRPGLEKKEEKRQRTPLLPPARTYRVRRFRLSLEMASQRPMFWQGSMAASSSKTRRLFSPRSKPRTRTRRKTQQPLLPCYGISPDKSIVHVSCIRRYLRQSGATSPGPHIWPSSAQD